MARLDVVEVVVEYPDAARAPARAVTVEHRQHVDRTADEAEVLFDAATDGHAAVARVPHDDHLAGVTLHPQVLRLTEGVFQQRRRAACTRDTQALAAWRSGSVVCRMNELSYSTLSPVGSEWDG